MSQDPAIGKRDNPTPDTGLSTDREGSLFDVTEWRKLQGLHGYNSELLRGILSELQDLNLKLNEVLSCK